MVRPIAWVQCAITRWATTNYVMLCRLSLCDAGHTTVSIVATRFMGLQQHTRVMHGWVYNPSPIPISFHNSNG